MQERTEAGLFADVLARPTIVVAPGVELVEDDEGNIRQRETESTLPVGQLGIALTTELPQIPAVSFPSGSEEFQAIPNGSNGFSGTPGTVGAMSVTTTSYPGFAKRLRDRRIELGMTFEDLAREAGVTSRSIRKWENGSTPNPAFVGRVCKPLGCKPAWLLDGEGKEPE